MGLLDPPIPIVLCLQVLAICATLSQAVAEDPMVEELVRVAEKNWQSDFAAWYEGNQENLANPASEKTASPHGMIAKLGDKFHFRHFNKWSREDGSFVYQRVDFVLDDQMLRADFANSGIRLTGRLKRGDSDEWVHYAAGTFGQLGWVGPEKAHSLRAVLSSDLTTLRVEQGEAIAECKLQSGSSNSWDTQLRFRQIGPQWFLHSIRDVYDEGFTVQVRDIEYKEKGDLWIVESCLLEAGPTRDGVFTPTVRDQIRLSDFKREVPLELLEIEELQDGTPVEVADLPVACEYRDQRIVVSSLASIGQAIETNSYTPTWSNRIPVIFFSVVLLVGMALLAYKVKLK
jgi:hypothetical protein